MNINIAVLITCHNRREKTIRSINALFASVLPVNTKLCVFLVDDGSTDGTEESVKAQFPLVNVIKGSGELYWNQGMRLAWDTAVKNYEFDFYLWLNDDTFLSKNAIIELLECYNEALEKFKNNALITGACQSNANSNEFSYGGRTDMGIVIPNGKLQSCKYINGNVVLVSKAIYNCLGNLSSDYTHTMGDFDYGLRAGKEGISCYTTKQFIAVCSINLDTPEWCNPDIPLNKRWRLLYSVKGLNFKEYIIFRRKFWGWRWIIYAIKAYAKVLVPKLYAKISNH